jgi:hypothetical protein
MKMYNNTNSNFTNLLPVTQNLPPNSYVALEEIAYTHCFFNIANDKNKLTIWDPLFENPPKSENNPFNFPIYGQSTVMNLKEGFYESLKDICDMLNQSLEDTGLVQFQGNEIFKYNPVSFKCSFNMKDIFASLFIRGPLLNILGIELEPAKDSQSVCIGISKEKPTYEFVENIYDPKKPDKIIGTRKVMRRYIHPTRHWKAKIADDFEHVAQLTTFQSMVVYCDIIGDQITGESFTNVLRFLPINKATPGTQIVAECKTPHFLKVSQRFFKSITIHIKDLEGNFVDFKMGYVRVKLRFKQQE